MATKFLRGTVWRSEFNSDAFEVVDEFDRDGRMRVLWSTNRNYLADVWRHDLRALRLTREQAPEPVNQFIDRDHHRRGGTV